MDLFKRIVKHYIIQALQGAAMWVDDDTHAELEAAMEDLDEHIRRVVREEIAAARKKATSKDEFWDRKDTTSMARSLRLSVIQNLFNGGHLTEDEAREILTGPLVPGDASTVYDDSACLEARR